ncbi:transposase (plasmid) [Aminobacter sp. SR38]|uniref:Mu transposase C-terminal domain-containing protein n=1 Tax=Aminobacter sp. SR38 TaxID=2774562 RepID=UPI0017864BF6|nr:Mu transposase C-terminal domain-containing protein [Aminobacter sp. SR38]QOF75015.1 transposase [Aminobacter sp. SR38]
MEEHASPIAERGTLGLSEEARQEAQHRYPVIAPLAAQELVSALDARGAAALLGMSTRSVYTLVARFRASGGLMSSLAPGKPSGGRGRSRMPERVDDIVTAAIYDTYLTRQKRRIVRLVEEVQLRCKKAGLLAPSAKTIRRRLETIRAEEVALRRDGPRSIAARRLTSAAGHGPVPRGPLDIVQIDHTPVDIILVDEITRLPVGRPWLTVAIDVYSRCIAGFLVSFEAPSATSVGLCLAHTGVDKSSYLDGLGLDTEWPIAGVPRLLHLDNAAEFHGEALARGCQQHGIDLEYRPKGQPHFGGVIERLIGTLMGLVHDLPGTTFSNPAERGTYDSDATAVLTLSELEHWLALAISGRYHHEVHEGIMEPPLSRWKRGIAEHEDPRPVANSREYLVDFLPVVRRTIQRDGFTLDHITYYSDVLRPWIANRNRCRSFLIRRDPRDLSQIFVLEPGGRSYVTVPCRRLERPRISLFEHRQAIRTIRAGGRAQVDEEVIFRTVEQQRGLVKAAAKKSRAARRQLARQTPVRESSVDRVAVMPAIETEVAGDDQAADLVPFPMERW